MPFLRFFAETHPPHVLGWGWLFSLQFSLWTETLSIHHSEWPRNGQVPHVPKRNDAENWAGVRKRAALSLEPVRCAGDAGRHLCSLDRKPTQREEKLTNGRNISDNSVLVHTIHLCFQSVCGDEEANQSLPPAHATQSFCHLKQKEPWLKQQ